MHTAATKKFKLPVVYPAISAEEVRLELQRVLDSSVFQHSQNLRRLLQHIVERVLSGGADEIKEYALGVEVFDRGAAFDPRADTIVRVEARRLRSKLDEYYAGEGASARICIAVPKGSYVPKFSIRRPSGDSQQVRSRLGRVLPPAAALLLLVAIGLALALWLWPKRPASPSYSAVPLTSYVGSQICPSFSPDGERVAFAWDGEKQDNFDIYVKQIGIEEPLRLTVDPRPDLSPAWSPDGRTIAFLRLVSVDRAELLLAPSLTGGPVRHLAEVAAPTQDYVGMRCLAWSSDSKWLVVPDGRSSDSIKGLYLVSVDTGQKRRLTFPTAAYDDSEPAFSPDSKRLVFARYSGRAAGDLYLLSLASDLQPRGEPKQITSYHSEAGSPVWSPDGRAILFARSGPAGFPSFWQMPLSDSSKAEPLHLPVDNSSSLAISAHGNRLVYTRETGEEDIWGVELPASLGGENLNLTPKLWIGGGSGQGAPQFSPDGKHIAFESPRSGHDEIWIAERDGSHQRQLTDIHATLVGFPRWSPDGDRIVFHARQDTAANLFVAAFPSGHVERITSGGDDFTPSWSRDGKWIYFGSRRTGDIQVWKLAVKGGAASQVTKRGGWMPWESVDGRYLYYATRNQPGLWRLPLAGGPDTKIVPALANWNSSYMPAQHGIYFIEPVDRDTAGTLKFLSFATGRITSIAAISHPAGLGLAISSDERLILYGQDDRAGSDLVLVENFR